jgi:hypothetical protein
MCKAYEPTEGNEPPPIGALIWSAFLSWPKSEPLEGNSVDRPPGPRAADRRPGDHPHLA